MVVSVYAPDSCNLTDRGEEYIGGSFCERRGRGEEFETNREESAHETCWESHSMQ